MGPLGVGVVLVTAGAITLFLHFTSHYIIFEPIWPGPLAMLVGALFVLVSMKSG